MSPAAKTFIEVYERLRDEVRAWQYLFGNEKIELTRTILSLMESAYDEAFTACEEQDSGFAGSTTWTNHNPYREDPDVLNIVSQL
jgi:hypothetical protein